MKILTLFTLFLCSSCFAGDFDSRFYHQLAKGSEGNINFSPLSLKMALHLVYLGTDGETKKLFEQELGFRENDRNPFKKEFALVTPEKLQISNSVWFKDISGIEDGYLKELKSQDVLTGALSITSINDWVSKSTHEKIKKIVDSLDPSTFSVFINAIYFKGDWQVPFEKQNTKEERFFSTKNKSKKVSMMNQTKRMSYFEDQKEQWVKLAYQDSPLVMLFGLPIKRFNLKTIEKDFSNEILAKIDAGMQHRKVQLSLPKFKFDQKGSLKELLLKMGLSKLFVIADYSRLSKRQDLNISDIIQATNISVDEKGTEAAAVTAVIMEMSMAQPGFEEKPKRFNADQPFMFVLKNEKTNEIYFMGRVAKP